MKPPPPISCAEALSRLREVANGCRVPAAPLPLAEARGAVLAADLLATGPLPPFDNAAMDGFAIAAGTSEAQALAGLELLGERFAGAGTMPAARPGGCIRITTGAPVPAGFDRVAVREQATEAAGGVRLQRLPEAGEHLRRAGEDVAAGDRLLAAGTPLDAEALSLAAAAGFAELPARRPPPVRVLVTGDELRAPGQSLAPGEIHESNGTLLAALLAREHGLLASRRHVPDDEDALARGLAEAAAGGGIVVSCGGASVGERDLVPALAHSLGRVHFWRVAIKPGMPVLLASLDRALLLALPGNPVSVFCGYFAFLRPLIDAMQGRAVPRPMLHAALGHALGKRHERLELRRGQLRCDAEGRLWVRAHPAEASNRIRALAESNALIRLPEGPLQRDAGDVVEVLPYGAILGP